MSALATLSDRWVLLLAPSATLKLSDRLSFVLYRRWVQFIEVWNVYVRYVCIYWCCNIRRYSIVLYGVCSYKTFIAVDENRARICALVLWMVELPGDARASVEINALAKFRDDMCVVFRIRRIWFENCRFAWKMYWWHFGAWMELKMCMYVYFFVSWNLRTWLKKY